MLIAFIGLFVFLAAPLGEQILSLDFPRGFMRDEYEQLSIDQSIFGGSSGSDLLAVHWTLKSALWTKSPPCGTNLTSSLLIPDEMCPGCPFSLPILTPSTSSLLLMMDGITPIAYCLKLELPEF
jgi:hypothetical protein